MTYRYGTVVRKPKGSSALFFSYLVVDKERTNPGHWPGSMLGEFPSMN